MTNEVPIGSLTGHIMFSCKGCGATDEVIEVMPRKTGEDIRHWMENLIELVGAYYWLNHPACRSERCDLKIPLGLTVETKGPMAEC